VIGGNVWLTQSVPPGSLVTEVAQIQKRVANDNDQGLTQ
jgi:hypothetical protein